MKVKVYWINLDSSIARANQIHQTLRNNLDQIGVSSDNVHRISALSPFDAPHFVQNAKSKWTQKQLETPALACTLSHLKAMQQALRDDCDWAILFEDDITFMPQETGNTNHSMIAEITNQANNADLLLFSWCVKNSIVQQRIENAIRSQKSWIKALQFGVFGSFAYAVSKSAMQSIVASRFDPASKLWNANSLENARPIAADRLLMRSKLRCLMKTVPSIRYKAEDSLVHTDHLTLHKDNLLFIQRCNDLQRSIKSNQTIINAS